MQGIAQWYNYVLQISWEVPYWISVSSKGDWTHRKPPSGGARCCAWGMETAGDCCSYLRAPGSTTSDKVLPSCPRRLFGETQPGDEFMCCVCSSPGCCPCYSESTAYRRDRVSPPASDILKTHTRRRVTLSVLTRLPAFPSLCPLALPAFSQPENKLRDVWGYIYIYFFLNFGLGYWIHSQTQAASAEPEARWGWQAWEAVSEIVWGLASPVLIVKSL